MPKQIGFAALIGFSARELQLIQLLAGGLTTTEAATHLGTRTKTVENMMRTLYCKTETGNLAALIQWAVTNAIDEPLPPETEDMLPAVVQKRSGWKVRKATMSTAGGCS